MADVRVSDFGANGADAYDDTTAIQSAIDSLGAAGGRVIFPAGNYNAAGIIHRSGVELVGEQGAVLTRTPGTASLISSDMKTLTGSIAKGSSKLTVTSGGTSFVPNAVVAIRGAGGGSTVQQTTLSSAVLVSGSPITVKSSTGFSTGTGIVLIDSEIVRYTSINSMGVLGGVTRGCYGTAVVGHMSGAPVRQARHLYARVVSVSGNTITLDRPAVFGVQSTIVYVGSVNMAVTGLTLDGNRPNPGIVENPFPLTYSLARYVTIGDCTIRDGEHGAISLNRGTADSLVERNTLEDCGDPESGLGSTLWIYQSAVDNTLRNNIIRDVGARGSTCGIMIDDRSVHATEWDGDCCRNLVEGNTISLRRLPTGTWGMFVGGSCDNRLIGNTVGGAGSTGPMFGAWVTPGGQGTSLPSTVKNVITQNHFADHYIGIRSDANDTQFTYNDICRADKPGVDTGLRNDFTGSLYEGAPLVCTSS
jgi:polygalacturonase